MCQCLQLAFIADGNVYLCSLTAHRFCKNSTKFAWLGVFAMLVISLFFAFPSIVLAEKYRKMRGIFLTANWRHYFQA